MLTPENVPGEDGFFPAASNSKWYANLKQFGNCIRLLELLKEDRTLIHELGREDMTVLHKGVQHGCVALMRFILVDVFDDHGLCKCSRHGASGPGLTSEQLLRKTCSYGSTVVNMAVVSGSPKMVVLLEWAIKLSWQLSEQSTEENSSENLDDIWEYGNVKAMCLSYVEITGLDEEVQTESTNITGNVFPVPEVRDDDLSMLYPSSSEVKSKVIAVIEGVHGDPGDEHRQWMDVVKKWFVKDVDFEFVPLGHVFLHYIFSISTTSSFIQEGFSDFLEDLQGGLNSSREDAQGGFNPFRKGVTKRIFEACGDDDGEDGESGSMLTTLFNILDPQGRTLLHAVYELKEFTFLHSFQGGLHNMSLSITVKCLNARDGASRSIFHLMAIHDQDLNEQSLRDKGIYAWFAWYIKQSRDGDLSLKEPLWSPQNLKLNVLKQWCFSFKNNLQQYGLTAFEFAILVNAITFINSFLPLLLIKRDKGKIRKLMII